MFASALSAWLGRRGIHYAWIVAAVTFLAMLSTAASLGLPGVLLQPLSREFGWDSEQISSVFAVRFILFGLMAPFSAMLMERFGLRRVACSALALIAGSLALGTQVSQLWQLFILWGLLLGIGPGLTAIVLGAVVANRWFHARRGLVIGMLAASTATGQLIFLPLAAWLVERAGWRAAVLPAIAACCTLVVLVLLFMRDRPRDIGLPLYGETMVAPPPSAATQSMSFRAPFTVLGNVSGSPVFWILAGTFFICGLSTAGLIQTHFISLCGDFGLEPVPAASVLAMMGAFDFVGTILSGWLSDRYDNRKLLFWYYGLRGLSLFWLPHSTFTLYGLSLFALFYGLDWLATVAPTVKLVGAHFGRERAGLIFGWIFAAHQLGSAVAAYGAGYSRTLLLTYQPALYAAGAACLAAALLVLAIRKAGAPGAPSLVPAGAR